MSDRFTLQRIPRDGPRPPWEQTWLGELARVDQHNRPLHPTSVAVIGSCLARELAERDSAVATTGDGWAFAAIRQATHPLTQVVETSVTRFAATAPTAATLLLAELRERELLDHCNVELDAIRDCRHDALAGQGFTEQLVVLRQEPAAAVSVAPDPALDIHVVRPTEIEFVVECLVTALRRGLGEDRPSVDLDEWARARYRPADPATLCLVGTWNGRPVCHGLGYRRPDRYGVRSVLYLADVFVIPEFQGRGISRMMSVAVMRAALERGCEVVESDVVLAPGSAKLREVLRDAGWREDRVRWRRE